ncbi:MAG TPA: DNA helicase RecQ [Treponemataceae bacterium]|nr:DNA helicase RecQ [Treponemataceae bacterium]
MSAPSIHGILKSVFGYDSFRPMQEDIINNVLAKRDTLAIMPTGGGKSLCYQVPALALPGLTVVVSPLIALMEDQVSQLEAAGIDALLLNSTLDRDEWFANTARVRSGQAKLLYIAPESLVNPRVQELLASVRVDCITIDEAHCISEWGHDFRPEYRRLAEIRQLFPHAVCLALTATATATVRKDIRKNLALENPAEFVASFDRPNIKLTVVRKSKPVHQILDFLEPRRGECGIIYCFSRKLCDDIAAELVARGHAALPYHAGLADAVRSENQAKFIADEARVMVATVAFGMGINKPNVRFVIHHDLPKSIEQYYQEIGRAGRDGDPAEALLLYGYGDTKKIEFFMEDKSAGETRKAEDNLKAMVAYAESRTCRRAKLLEWFGESYAPAEPKESCCDVCDGGPLADSDVTVPAQKFMSCVARTGQRYGTAYVADVLLGSRQKRIIENGHNKISTWGIGRDLEKDDWFELARVLTEAGYLRKEPEYGVLSLTSLARETLAARDAISLPFAPATAAMAKGGNASAESAPDGSRGTVKFPKKTRASAVAEDPAAAPILAALKAMRRALAEAASVPPYVIFSDRTLEDIAVRRPSTGDDLLGVYGIGEVKRERYGEYILRAVKEATE